MSPNEPLDQMDSIDSAPQPPRLRRGLLVAGAVVLAMGATALTGAALAGVGGGGTNDDITLAAGSGSASPTASADARTKREKAKAKLREWRFAHRGHGPLIGGPFGALHGEFVVPDGSGGYRTVVVQRGTASQVGDDTITVKSEDGFSQAYDVPAAAVVGAERDGLASIDEGDDVMVTAQKKGDTLTAQMVADLDSWRGSAPFGFGGPGGPGGMGGQRPGPLEGPGDDSGAGPSETAPPTGT